jgi:hypothetical protein
LASNGKTTAYDAAVAAAATQSEKDRLRDLRLRFNTPPDSPEWQFYAVLAPLLVPSADREQVAAQLERIEARLTTPKKSNASPIAQLRDLISFCFGVFTCVVVAVLAGSSPPPTFVALIAVFALGIGAAIAYQYLAPMIMRRK